MVRYHNRRINYDTQRHSDSGHGVNLNIHPKQLVEKHSAQQVHNDRKTNHGKVSDTTAHRQHKQQKYGQ